MRYYYTFLLKRVQITSKMSSNNVLYVCVLNTPYDWFISLCVPPCVRPCVRPCILYNLNSPFKQRPALNSPLQIIHTNIRQFIA